MQSSIPKIRVIQGDITQIKADAIVNAANSSLLGGGGVDGAIHRVGGKAILAECRAIRERQGKCPTGEVVITTAGNLPAKYVIHTVGPVWNGGHQNEAELLKQCYINSLKLAELYGAEHIAFPNISTGAYRFPKDLAAQIAFDTVKNWQGSIIKQITFVCFDEENFLLSNNLINPIR